MVRKLVCSVHVLQSVCGRKDGQSLLVHMGSESRCVASDRVSPGRRGQVGKRAVSQPFTWMYCHLEKKRGKC